MILGVAVIVGIAAVVIYCLAPVSGAEDQLDLVDEHAVTRVYMPADVQRAALHAKRPTQHRVDRVK